MSADSLNPLDELEVLRQNIPLTSDIAGLKPIFKRADELGRQHSDDFEVQLAVSVIKERLIDRGKLLKQAEEDQEKEKQANEQTQEIDEKQLPGAARPKINIPPPRLTRAVRPPPLPPVRNIGAQLPPAPPNPPADLSTGLSTTDPSQPGMPFQTEAAPLAAFAPPGTELVQRPAEPPPGPAQPVPGGGFPAPLAATSVPGILARDSGVRRPASGVRKPSKPGKKKSGNKVLIAIAALGVILIAIVGFALNQAHRKRLTAAVPIQVATTPPGASVRINGEQMCTSNCNLSLPPGNYQITAFMDGYDAGASNVSVQAAKPAFVNLVLAPQPQSVRVLTDLENGIVAFDALPPVDLQDGQIVFEKVPPGTHTFTVSSKTGEATFSVQIADAKQPVVDGPVRAKNLMAVLVASVGSKARIVTSAGPWRLSLNGQQQPDATPEGVDLTNFQPGVDEILVGEGKQQRNMKESFGPTPMLTAFLKSDLNIGTLIISTGEDDVRVFVNNKEYARKTQRGQVRVPAIGPVSVRVVKDGFDTVPFQTADVKKGSEVRLEFKMQAMPQFAVLQVRGATPQTEVVVDDKAIGTVGEDGAFTSSNVKPGDHVVELRRDRFLSKKLQRTFRAGQTMSLTGADVLLAAASGSVKISRAPADAVVTYHRVDDQQTHEVKDGQVDLAPGAYIFTARAPGFTERAERLQVTAGETRPVELALAKIVTVAAPAPPKVFGMADFEDPGAWSSQNGLWIHKGAGFIPFKPAANGIFTFTVQLLHGGNLFHGGRIRWAVQYLDARNYDLFELDKKYLGSKVIVNGKTFERERHEHGLSEKDKSYTIQIEVKPELLIHRVKQPDGWAVLDTWAEPERDFTQGKFGFLVQGTDEIGLSDFKFTAKPNTAK